ncbi:MAG: DNA-3-methyladenine glycosylase [Thermoleophilia bacterium]|nr:DNA-3-methyladenine glycosylase [Thermoleophilia bacterium]MCZ4495876.1 DNA-3-methyladenine glycosylase [Thermoleophilia bacterium]
MLDATRHPAEVAPDLLGWTIACRGTAAVLVEVEAYHQDEPAAHSFGGLPTPRTQDLFGPPGTIYVYFTYGMHWCANLVTGPEGSGEAVLLRGAVPVHGEQLMRARRAAPRGVDPAKWRTKEIAGGPGRLTQALDIRAEDSGTPILRADVATLADALSLSVDGPVLVRDAAAARSVGIELPVAGDALVIGPRIGITKAMELAWRFGVRGSAGLSRGF